MYDVHGGAMRAVVFLALIGAVVCRTLDEQWHSWKSSHGKVYADTAEEMARRKIWLDNSARIEEYNRGNHSFSMALNRFADMVRIYVVDPERFAYMEYINLFAVSHHSLLRSLRTHTSLLWIWK